MPFDQSEEKWTPCNKGILVRQKAPLEPQEVWSIRVRLQLADNKLDLALFNLAIYSKLADAICCSFGIRTCALAARLEVGPVYSIKDGHRGSIRSHQTNSRCSRGLD